MIGLDNPLSPRRPSRPSRAAAIVLTLLLGASGSAFGAGSDAEALAVAERTLEAMGGQEAWDRTRYLRFDFFGFRKHHWDRYTGRHRLEGKTREGESYVVLHTLGEGGRAWLDGRELAGEEKKKWLEQAHGAWVNDTYWLIMPYKLRDPGVMLEYQGTEEIDGTAYDKLMLTFEGVGLTPGDRYWAYIDRETGLMDRWAYHLQDWEEEREPTAWSWQGWRRFGGILLAPDRIKLDDGRQTELGDIAVFDELPDSVFTSPEPVTGE